MTHSEFDIEYAKNPVRKSPHTIDLIVKFYGFAQEVPFTAFESDTEAHGRLLYANSVKGDYGPLA